MILVIYLTAFAIVETSELLNLVANFLLSPFQARIR